MEKTFKIFHYISFVQYPFLVIALYYCYKPIIFGFDNFNTDEIIASYNSGLLFLGIGLSFTSLADINKRTKLGDKIFGKRKNARRWLIYVGTLIFAIFAMAIILTFFGGDKKVEGLSTGLFVLGIGMIGILRMNLEIIRSYQKDWE